VRAGADLIGPALARATSRQRFALYALLGAAASATLGPWLVLVLVGCGLAEILRSRSSGASHLGTHAWPLFAATAGATGGLAALAWVALKVGALSYGGGFVIIPLMQGDSVHRYHWMTDAQFLNAVALGQVTPGPVVLTVAVVGYAAAGLAGGLLAAFALSSPRSPSYSSVPATSTSSAPTHRRGRSCPAPARPPSAPSSVPRSRSRSP